MKQIDLNILQYLLQYYHSINTNINAHNGKGNIWGSSLEILEFTQTDAIAGAIRQAIDNLLDGTGIFTLHEHSLRRSERPHLSLYLDLNARCWDVKDEKKCLEWGRERKSVLDLYKLMKFDYFFESVLPPKDMAAFQRKYALFLANKDTHKRFTVNFSDKDSPSSEGNVEDESCMDYSFSASDVGGHMWKRGKADKERARSAYDRTSRENPFISPNDSERIQIDARSHIPGSFIKVYQDWNPNGECRALVEFVHEYFTQLKIAYVTREAKLPVLKDVTQHLLSFQGP